MESLQKLVDPEPPEREYDVKPSLLRKYEIPIHHLDFEYVNSCTNGKELEKILHILQSGEEGHYPQLLTRTEERLAIIKPNSKYINKVTEVIEKKHLEKSEQIDLTDDFNNWLENINRNNNELGSIKKKKIAVEGLPEIRKSEQQASEPKKEANLKRIKSTDYSSWDKYDPDTEILKMDLQQEKLIKDIEKKKHKIPEEKKKSIKFNQFQTQAEAAYEANREKEKGNEYFRAGEYKEAYINYTNSINYLPCTAAYNNRAITNIKLNQFEEAIKDGLAAIKYEPNNVKANLRIAQSYDALQQYNQALDYIEKVIELDPNNTVAQSLSNKINRELKRNCNLPKSRLKIIEIDDENANTHKKIMPQRSSFNNKKPKIIEIENKKKVNHRSILKPTKPSHVVLSIPGTSHMREPYFFVVENKDPELIRRQEYMLNNRPQLLHFTSVDSSGDDSDCTEIHVIKSDSKLLQDIIKSTIHNVDTCNTRKGSLQYCNSNQNNNYIDINTSSVDNNIKDEPIIDCLENSDLTNNDNKRINVTNIAPSKEDVLKNIAFEESMNNMNIQVSDSSDISDDDIEIVEISSQEFNNCEMQAGLQQNDCEVKIRNEIHINEIIRPPILAAQINDNGGGGEPHIQIQNDGINVNQQELHIPFTFLRTWNSVSRDDTYMKHAEILRNLDVHRFTEVIGYKLDGSMLSDILRTLYLHFTVAHEVERVFNILNSLTILPRFNIMAMFLSCTDRQKLKCILEFLEQHGKPLSSDTQRLYNR